VNVAARLLRNLISHDARFLHLTGGDSHTGAVPSEPLRNGAPES
jgi:hypothetical protein